MTPEELKEAFEALESMFNLYAEALTFEAELNHKAAIKAKIETIFINGQIREQELMKLKK